MNFFIGILLTKGFLVRILHPCQFSLKVLVFEIPNPLEFLMIFMGCEWIFSVEYFTINSFMVVSIELNYVVV